MTHKTSRTAKRVTLKDLNAELAAFIYSRAEYCNNIYGGKWPGFNNFPLRDWVATHPFFVYYENGHPRGFLFATLAPSVLDRGVKILTQQSLYSDPGTRGASMLLKEFIDFGRLNANHIITMIGARTNIKPRSLERLGFKELETLYRLEV